MTAKRCRHYRVHAAPELGEGWLRCADCQREYEAAKPQRHQVHAKQQRASARDGAAQLRWPLYGADGSST